MPGAGGGWFHQIDDAALDFDGDRVEDRHLDRLTPSDVREQLALGDALWFQHGGGSPTPAAVHDAVTDAARRMHEDWPDWTERYYADRSALREGIGRLLNAPADTIAITRGTAHGLSLVARGLRWRAGDNVVGVRWEYPTNLLPWMALGEQGVELRLVEPVDGRVTVDAILDLVDDRTRVVALSHVEFWNGYRADIASLGAACRERGIISVVDAAQSAGAVQLDVSACAVDVVASTASKWLMGPVGTGLCYIASEVVEQLTPPLVGYGSVLTREVFAPVLDLAPDARRFQESAPSWFDIAGFRASIELLERVGHDVIEDRVLALTSRLGEQLADAGFTVVGPWPRTPDESSGIISVRHPDVPADELAERLAAGGVTAGVHGDVLRLSPHFYNTSDDVDRVVELLIRPDDVRVRA